MEASHLPPPSFTHHQKHYTRRPPLSITKQGQLLPSKLRLRARALGNSIHVAVVSSSGSPGSLAVLIPISGVLLFTYWIANFVVPEMIIKDFKGETSDDKEEPEVEVMNISERKKASKKIKKSSIKNMTAPRCK